MQRPPKYGQIREKQPSPATYSHESPMGSYSSPEVEEGFEGSAVDFIFMDHTSLSNVGRALDEAQATDPKVVAIESPGLSRDEKIALEQKMDGIIHGHATIPDMLPGYSDLDPLYKTMCKSLFGSNATIRLIDIDAEDPRFKTVVEPANEALREWSDSGDTKSALYDRYTTLYAHADALREEIMTEQIQDIIAKNPNQKIAVVLGSAHTPVYHETRGSIPSARQFVPEDTTEPWEGSEIMNYNESTRDIRAKRLALIGHHVVHDPQSNETK